jgi:iron(II)-dependent oxidoreductase
MDETAALLVTWVREARQRTLELTVDLREDQLLGPRLAIVNPFLWEIGHVGWFQEYWVLRHALGEAPLRADGDRLYDSAKVPHDDRWDLPLPSRQETLAYIREVRNRVVARLESQALTPELAYFVRLSVFHEDMHDEAFTYTRQTHGWSPPRITSPAQRPPGTVLPAGDAKIPGGTFLLGAAPDGEPFVFDNEKWAHPVEVKPFAIARAPVTQGEFAAFVDAGGYRQRDFWSEAGWKWREEAGAKQPVYWSRTASGGFQRRHFDAQVALEPFQPVIHVSWYEAEAFCRWAGRRLPTEVEWEVAAAGEPGPDGRLAPHKRRFPWGDSPPAPERASLDWSGRGCVDVSALPDGDSAFGCRQLMGNVWEWTSSDFLPYPDFIADPYEEYSQPWFATHKVLRGGCWVTRSRLLRNTWRNFYPPHRRDVWAGFRTCAP